MLIIKPLLLIDCAFIVSGFHFFMGHNSFYKCFIEELPEETTVKGTYKGEIVYPDDKQPPQEILAQKVPDVKFTVINPDHKQMMAQDFKTGEGRFTFISNVAGNHKICLVAFDKRYRQYEAKLKVTFHLSKGEMSAEEYAKLAVEQSYDELQLRVRQLLAQSHKIRQELNYQIYRERKFRDLSTRANQRVLHWAAAQTVIVLLVAFWQMRNLKHFLIKKKVI